MNRATPPGMNTDALAATVVAAVRARGPQRLSTVETIADATGLSPRDVRAGLTAARLAGRSIAASAASASSTVFASNRAATAAMARALQNVWA